MTTTNGAFALRTVEDLLKKLKHDMKRLEASPTDSYAAFDFFITAFHMQEWPDNRGSRVRSKYSHEKVLMDVCAHLANGSKHFSVGSNESIKGTEHVDGGFDSSLFQADSFQVERLLVHLKGKAAQLLGEIVEATALGRKVLEYWEAKVMPPNRCHSSGG